MAASNEAWDTTPALINGVGHTQGAGAAGRQGRPLQTAYVSMAFNDMGELCR